MQYNKNLDYYATIVAELYSNQTLKDYVPTLNKGMKRNAGNNTNSSNKTKNLVEVEYILNLFICDDYSYVSGKEKIDLILRKTIKCNLPSKVELTENGRKRDNIKKALDILKLQINNLNAKNINKVFDDEINKKKNEVAKLNEINDECLKNGNFEIITDYKNVAIKCIEILSKATCEFIKRRETRTRELNNIEKEGEKLYELINQKLGIKLDKRKHWIKEKENEQYSYEFNKKETNMAEILCNELGIKNENDEPKQEVKRESNFYKRFVERQYNSYVPPHLQKEKEEIKVTPKIELFDLESNSNNTKEIKKNIGCWGKKLEIKKEEKQETQEIQEIKNNVFTKQEEEKESSDEWCKE